MPIAIHALLLFTIAPILLQIVNHQSSIQYGYQSGSSRGGASNSGVTGHWSFQTVCFHVTWESQ
jgi:hypothetical protein